MFFDSWMGLLRVLVVGVLAYAALVVLLRVSGNRTLSKLNAFDLVVTVALGSTLSSILLTESVALVEGIAAFSLLVGLQLAVTWVSVRSRTFSRLVTSEPRLLVFQGQVLPRALRAERVTMDEVLAVLRASGCAGLEDVEALVLESDGSLSLVPRAKGPSPQVLRDVRRPGGQTPPLDA